ncbi:ribonuclease H-like domain-containing protein [Tanacetum coccineum]
MAEQDTPPPTITTMKIPIIKKGEYDIWSMRMRQYICYIDQNFWDIIVDGDFQEKAAPAREQSGPPAPKTVKQLTAKRNHERVKSILLLAIPDEYLLKFHNVPDAKSLWAAIKSRFGGNEESKKMQKKVLKHQFENFTTAPNENTRSTMKLVLPVENFGVNTARGTSSTSQGSSTPVLRKRCRDSFKTGRNLDFKGKQHVTFDKSKVECYNCHRKGHFAQECKSGRNQGKKSYGDNGKRNATTNEPSSQALVAQAGLGGYDWSNDLDEPVNYALMAISSSSSSSSSDNENELAWGGKYEFQNYELKCREVKINNLKMELEKVVKERDELNVKIEKWEESSKGLNKLLNSQMSAKDKNGLGYGTQLDEISNKSETNSEISMSVFEVRSSNEEITPTNDRFSKADRYHAVPPPVTGNFLTPRADISFGYLVNI